MQVNVQEVPSLHPEVKALALRLFNLALTKTGDTSPRKRVSVTRSGRLAELQHDCEIITGPFLVEDGETALGIIDLLQIEDREAWSVPDMFQTVIDGLRDQRKRQNNEPPSPAALRLLGACRHGAGNKDVFESAHRLMALYGECADAVRSVDEEAPNVALDVLPAVLKFVRRRPVAAVPGFFLEFAREVERQRS